MKLSLLPDPAFWKGKRVLLTGHTGFKGAWLGLWLNKLGAVVTGVSLPPHTTPSLFKLLDSSSGTSHFCDVRDAGALRDRVHIANPQIVIHLAAQALVRPSYIDPLTTWSSNVMGTAHVLDALLGLEDVRVAVMVTTDKVYRNQEWAWPYREDDPLGGHDPYSASKAACELVIASYRDAFLSAQGVAVASARAGNVIGGGDWSEDRIIPDAIRAWQAGGVLSVRRPESIRPWQHVLEPLAGYLRLAETLWHTPTAAGAYNFGPHSNEAATVRSVVEWARAAYGQGDVDFGSNSDGPHETGSLTLESSKARDALGVQPKWSLEVAVQRSLNWYRLLNLGNDARTLCLQDIEQYEGIL